MGSRTTWVWWWAWPCASACLTQPQNTAVQVSQQSQVHQQPHGSPTVRKPPAAFLLETFVLDRQLLHSDHWRGNHWHHTQVHWESRSCEIRHLLQTFGLSSALHGYTLSSPAQQARARGIQRDLVKLWLSFVMCISPHQPWRIWAYSSKVSCHPLEAFSVITWRCLHPACRDALRKTRLFLTTKISKTQWKKLLFRNVLCAI